MTSSSKSGALYARVASLLTPGPIPQADRHRFSSLVRLGKVAEALERSRLAAAVAAGAEAAPEPIVPAELVPMMQPRAFGLLLAPELARAVGRKAHTRDIYRALSLAGLVKHCEELADQLIAPPVQQPKGKSAAARSRAARSRAAIFQALEGCESWPPLKAMMDRSAKE